MAHNRCAPERQFVGRDPDLAVPPPETQSAWQTAAICGLLLAAVALVFGQTVRHDFVNLDDNLTVYDNPMVAKGLSLRAAADAFTDRHANTWVPVCWLSHMLDCGLYGVKSAGGHHVTNLLLHAATTVLLFLVLWRMTGRQWPSALAAALFALHPLRAESVAWVTERKDVLSGLFFVLTIAAYASYARHRFSLLRYLAVLVLFALGLMSKPMLVTLPLLLLLLDYWPLGRMNTKPRPAVAPGGTVDGAPFIATNGRGFVMKLVLEKLPLVVLATGCCGMTIWAQGAALSPNDVISLDWRINNALISYATYLGHLFYPADLAVVYPRVGSALPFFGKALAALIVLTGVTAVAWFSRRKRPYLLVGWLWYLGMLLPVIGLVQFGVQAVADRFTYLPHIGLAIALAWLAADAYRFAYRRRFCIAIAVTVAAFMGCAWRQASFWFDSETLWTRTLACTSANKVAHGDYAIFLESRGRTDEAMAHYRKILEIDPRDIGAENDWALALARGGRLDEAMAHYERALELKPDYKEAHNNLGLALVRRGWFDEAIAHYQRALAIDPHFAEAHNNLGHALAARELFNEAIVNYDAALKTKPDFAEAHNNLGHALARSGRSTEAPAHFEESLRIKPDFAEAHYNFGNALMTADRLDEAIAHYRQAVGKKDDFADAHAALGAALARRGQFDQALASYQKAASLDPDNPKLHNNFGVALADCGRTEEAVAHYQKALQADAGFADAHFNLANALADLDRLDEAAEHYRKVLAIYPNLTDARDGLVNVLAVLGRLDEAAAGWRKALEAKPDDIEARINLAWLRAACPVAALRNGTEAVELAKRADRLSGGRADVLDVLAAAYAEAGRFPEALSAARKALDLANREKRPALADALRIRIGLYEAGRPYRRTLAECLVPPPKP